MAGATMPKSLAGKIHIAPWRGPCIRMQAATCARCSVSALAESVRAQIDLLEEAK
jgi:hypothetical protein